MKWSVSTPPGEVSQETPGTWAQSLRMVEAKHRIVEAMAAAVTPPRAARPKRGIPAARAAAAGLDPAPVEEDDDEVVLQEPLLRDEAVAEAVKPWEPDEKRDCALARGSPR